MKTKGISGVEIKDADAGTVTAVFATFDVVDSDGDVTKQGAFEDGAEVVISSYGHTSWSGMLPVGKGIIRSTATQALLEGEFFLDTTHGKDAFTTVKRLGPLGQWSYGYDPVKFSYGQFDDRRVRFLEQQKVHEVSPVLLGAGVGTRTLAAKSGGLTFHDEATAVLAAVTGLVDRAADVMAKRAEKGKGLGADSDAVLQQLDEQFKRLTGLRGAPEPGDTSDLSDELARQYLRFASLTRAA